MKKNKRRSRRLVNTKKRNQIGKKKIKRVWPTKFQVCGGKSVHTEKMFHHLVRKPNEKSTETSTHYELGFKSTRNENISTTLSLLSLQKSLATGLKARGCSVGVWRHKMFPSFPLQPPKISPFSNRARTTTNERRESKLARTTFENRSQIYSACEKELVTFARSLRTF